MLRPRPRRPPEGAGARILVLNATYVPDPSSTGQHLHDAAAALVARGHTVTVLTANRGYEDPKRKYPSREERDGVVIRRIPFSSFGKRSFVARVGAALSFVVQTAVRGVLSRRPDVVLVSTSPPLCPAAALAVSWLRGVPIFYWIHDLHPALALRVGMVRDHTLSVRLMNALNRRILGRASRIVVLDRFMNERVQRKLATATKTTILPPWPHNDAGARIEHGDNPWRRKHVGNDRRVVMYSGNHSPAHPLDTLLRAVLRFQDDDGIEFLFVGGGLGKPAVDAVIERQRPPNVRSLPYQPLEMLRHSLAAADVHVVAVGDGVPGISHPCKIYGALAAGRPVLLFGPTPCHVTDIVARHAVGWRVAHGDVNGAVATLREIRDTPAERLEAMGRAAQELVRRCYSRDILLNRFCDVVEATLGYAHGRTATVPAGGRVGRAGTPPFAESRGAPASPDAPRAGTLA